MIRFVFGGEEFDGLGKKRSLFSDRDSSLYSPGQPYMAGPVPRVDPQGKKVTQFAKLGHLVQGKDNCHVPNI